MWKVAALAALAISDHLKEQQSTGAYHAMGLYKFEPTSDPDQPEQETLTINELSGFRIEQGACLIPDHSAFRKCKFRRKTGGPMNLLQCASYGEFFQATAIEASEQWGVTDFPNNREQFCDFILPWDADCETWLTTKMKRPLGKPIHELGYYDTSCTDCGIYQNSNFSAFHGRVTAERVRRQQTGDHSVAVVEVHEWALNRTNWACAWLPQPQM